MSSKTRFLTLTGFILLITGLILGTIGFFSNGPEELGKLNTPVSKKLTFDNIKALDINLNTYYIETEESKDGKIHVSYQYFEKEKFNKIDVEEKNGQLRIIQKDYYGNVVQLPLDAISRELSQSKHKTRRITLALPKGLTLDELKASVFLGDPLHLANMHLKNVDFANYVSADNVTIDGGIIRGGEFNNTTIKDTKIENYTSFTLKNATLDNVSVKYINWFNVEKSTIKNTTINSEYADFVATDLILENSKITSQKPNEIDIKNLTVKGNVVIKSASNTDEQFYGGGYDYSITLSDASRSTTNLSLTTNDDSKVKTNTIKDLTSEGTTLMRTIPNSPDKLTITNQFGNIIID